MRFMVLVKATKGSEAGGPPDAAMMEEMGKFNDELAQAGVLLAVDGLHPSSKGARVNFFGTERTVTKGPFTETEANELVCGYWIWKCASLEEAIEWAKRCPNPHADDSHIEIRQIAEMEDFGDDVTQEIREREKRLAQQMEAQQ